MMFAKISYDLYTLLNMQDIPQIKKIELFRHF